MIVSLSCVDGTAGAGPSRTGEHPYEIDLDVAAGRPSLITDTGDHCSGTGTTGHLDADLSPDQLPTRVRVAVGSAVDYSLAVYAVSSAYTSTLVLTYDTPS